MSDTLYDRHSVSPNRERLAHFAPRLSRFRLPSWLRASASVAIVLGYLAIQSLDGTPFPLIVAFLLSAWALLGPIQAIQALTLSWLGCTLNWDIYSSESLVTAFQVKWLILFSAAASVYWRLARSPQPIPAAVLFVFFFSAVAMLTSMVKSYAPVVSVLKLVSFFVGATTVLLAYHLARQESQRLELWLISVAIGVVVASLPLVFMDIGYKWVFRGPKLLKGILIAPQEFAVFLAPLAAWLTGSLMTAGKHTRLEWVLVTLLWILLVLSGSRTGFGAAVGALVLTLLTALVFQTRWRRSLSRVAARPSTALAALGLCLVALLHFDSIVDRAGAFVFKRAESLTEEYQLSRAKLVTPALENFSENPLFGYGFGVRSQEERHRVGTGFLGIPFSAPTEKGVLYIAVLEECGLIGFGLFIIMIISVLRPIFLHAAFPYGCAAVAVLLVNLGEANFFSFGGMGLYEWLILGFAAVGGPARSHAQTAVDSGTAGMVPTHSWRP